MAQASLELVNRLGLHARAASKLTKLCGQFKSDVLFDKNGQKADGRNIMSIMLLAAAKGSVLEVTATGPDEEQALAAVAQLFAERFGEPD